jgi:putative aldouronate transport system permease protein
MNQDKGFLYELRKNKVLFLMVLPGILYFFIFAYLPMSGIVLAFKNYRFDMGVFGSPWIGFDNFKFFFTSGSAALVTRNTILFNLINILTCHGMAIIIAIIITEMNGKYYKKTFQSFMFLPYFISWVIVGAFAYNFFNFEHGTLNTLLKSLNLQPVDIYGTPRYWILIIPLLNSWKWVGYVSVMYIAAIMGIDSECYEAANIDGANVFQKIFSITIPSITPTIVIMLLLQVGRLLRGDFEMFYQLIGNNGILFQATDVIDTFVFRSLLNSQEIGMPAAAGLYQSLLCLIIILAVNKLVKKYSKDMALF